MGESRSAYQFGPFQLQVDRRRLLRDGEPVALAPKALETLLALVEQRDRVLTKDELLQRIWGRRATHRDRTVDVCVRRLREKIDSRSSRHSFIQTRYGVGYSLEPVPK